MIDGLAAEREIRQCDLPFEANLPGVMPTAPNFTLDIRWLSKGEKIKAGLRVGWQQGAGDCGIDSAMNAPIKILGAIIGEMERLDLAFRPGGAQVREVPDHI